MYALSKGLAGQPKKDYKTRKTGFREAEAQKTVHNTFPSGVPSIDFKEAIEDGKVSFPTIHRHVIVLQVSDHMKVI